ncbi:hypothetical protein GUITHDRAFT_121647 [Guillardia theta CCMP2712]|uniref:Uncharacterized protein n=1 Tax=Guillardia theta (strain CCMP2712) TaxID=905079 RepID=L1I7G0_GUITC|nr:hypothetical protein GUITHDRAFT_121647 [Guillardia theta CCMP2712]EKX32188.1 hypothetical protein GUITHDRAFT_121647 [Guillardia theta CCMP2712]|eukprot:XP_005819168.1 hypothetical protein GUITHDRAFT_121647 [Guillardia theta CCMP2712]
MGKYLDEAFCEGTYEKFDIDNFTYNETIMKLRTDDMEMPILSMLVTRAKEGGEELLVTGDGEGRIRVWETETWKQLVQFAGHRCGVTTMIVAETGQIISGGADNDIWSWNLLSFKGEKLIAGVPPIAMNAFMDLKTALTVTWNGHDASIFSLGLVNATREGVEEAGGGDRKFEWKGSLVRTKEEVEGDGGFFRALVSGDFHGKIMVWDTRVKPPELVAELDDHAGPVRVLEAQEEKNLLFSAGEDWAINVWRTDTFKLVRRLMGHGAPVRCLRRVGELLLSGSMDCSLRGWNLLAGGQPVDLALNHTGWVMNMHVDEARERIITGCSDGGVYVWDLSSHALLSETPTHDGWVLALAMVTGGRVVSSSSELDLAIRPLELC